MKDIYEPIEIDICQVPDADVITASEIEIDTYAHENTYFSFSRLF